MSVMLSLNFEVETCVTCGIQFAISTGWQQRVKETKQHFYCPNGHNMYYLGKSKDQEIADLKLAMQHKDNQLAEERRKKDQLERRISRGVCIHCKRTFPNLARHMACKHPDKK